MTLKAIWELLRDAWLEWEQDKAQRLAAALSYYMMFSLVPLLILVIEIIDRLFGEGAAENQIARQIRDIVGEEGARAILTLTESVRTIRLSPLGTVIGAVALVFGATHVFAQLKDALNTIWQVMPRPGRGIKGFLVDRILAFMMVLGVGFFVLLSILVAAGLTVLGRQLDDLLPGLSRIYVLRAINVAIGLIANTLLFAMLYKVLPDAKITWSDVWIGAGVTSALFTAGQFLIGVYIGSTRISAAFGTAGSVIIILIWIYFSAQLIYFGAELTWVYANRYGSRIEPADGALPLTEDARARQGVAGPEEVEATTEGAHGARL